MSAMGIELTEAIMRARQLKVTLDKRVIGGLEIRQDKSLQSKALASTGIYTFRVFFKNRTLVNVTAIRNTVRNFGGASYEMEVHPNTAYPFSIRFQFGGDN
jgi:hypothetical protein